MARSGLQRLQHRCDLAGASTLCFTGGSRRHCAFTELHYLDATIAQRYSRISIVAATQGHVGIETGQAIAPPPRYIQH